MEPGQVFLAGGIYMPDPELLKRIRQEIYYSIADFKKVFSNKEFRKYFTEIDDYEKMKKPPKDYPADFADIDLLKYKSYTVSYALDEKVLSSPKLAATALSVFKAMHPFNEFLSRAKEV
jgi:uncharacterized protein (TIGR02453 family)